MKTISDREFFEQYRPITNPLDSNAAYGGCLLSISGKEFELVQQALEANPNCVWTYLDGGEEWPTLCSGFSVVNRLGYVITEVAADGFVEVVDED